MWRGDKPPAERGLVVLGTRIGHLDFVQAWAAERMQEERKLLQQLPELPDLQCSWPLLSMCAYPEPIMRFARCPRPSEPVHPTAHAGARRHGKRSKPPRVCTRRWRHESCCERRAGRPAQLGAPCWKGRARPRRTMRGRETGRMDGRCARRESSTLISASARCCLTCRPVLKHCCDPRQDRRQELGSLRSQPSRPPRSHRPLCRSR